MNAKQNKLSWSILVFFFLVIMLNWSILVNEAGPPNWQCFILIIQYLRRCVLIWLEPVLMDNPIGFLAIRSTSFVEHKCFPHPNQFCFVINSFVSSRGFPKSSHGRSISPCPRWIFLVFVTKKVPFILFLIPDSTSLCNI